MRQVKKLNMRKDRYEILSGSTTGTTTYQIPIYLECSVDEMGIMVGFDGTMEQIEQFCNFTYAGGAIPNSLIIYNTLNTNKLKTLIDSVFSVSWGDGSTGDTISMPTVYDTNLPYASHTYISGGIYDVEISIESPWKVEKLKRSIYLPITGNTFPTDFGVLTFTVPYSDPPVTVEQTYLEDYTTLTGDTDPVTGVTISFLAVGKSRIDENRMYGKSNTYTGLTITSTYTGYTIDDLFYMDYDDGYTYITGNTLSYYVEELYNGMITRNEHLIGFLDEPQIYSDIFIERGKQGVMERNLRLGEIDSTGELDIYGSGYFKVKKQ
jgi:hypothetical protein